MLEHALDYVARGWAVLPLHTTDGRRCSCSRGLQCPSPGKHPRTADGVTSASTDVQQVREWWARWPDAWIGVATGAASGAWVLDIDTGAPPGGLSGVEAARALQATRGALGGLQARTGGGGAHVWYLMPADGRPVRNRQRMRLSPDAPQTGLDVRGTGGYVVVPPSGHHSGGAYQWTGGELAPAPDWLLDIVAPQVEAVEAPVVQVTASDRERRYAQRLLANACERIATTGAGSRHEALNREAFSVGGFAHLLDGLDAVVDALTQAAVAAGKSEREARRTAHAGVVAGMERPRQVPDREGYQRDRAADPSWDETPDLLDDEQGVPVHGFVGPAAPQLDDDDGPPMPPPPGEIEGGEHAHDDGRRSPHPTAPPAAQQGRPSIRVNGRQMADVLADAWHAVVGLPDERAIYRQDGRCVRILSSETGPRIDPMTSGAMTAALLDAAHWTKRRPAKRGEQSVDGWIEIPADRLPGHLVPAMLERPPLVVPVLERVARAPYVARDGSTVRKVGYHGGARTYLAPHDPCPSMSIDEAVELVRDWLSDFPFVADHDLAHAVGFLVTPIVRLLIDGAVPMTVFDAPTPGTGKSLLMEVLARVGAAYPVHPAALAQNDEERRKSLVAHLSTGAPVVLLDNVTGRLDDNTLAGILTAWPRYSDRRMGGQSLVQVPASAVWAMSSNNAQMSADIARRSVVVRLDAKRERPETRSGFRHADLRGYTSQAAPRLRAAVLAMAEHWIAMGCPDGPGRLGSYEAWARVVGGIVNEAGFEGFLQGREARMRAANPEVEEWRQLIATWLRVRAGESLRASDVAALAAEHELLLHVLGDGSKLSQARRMAAALRRQRGRLLHVAGADRELAPSDKPGAGNAQQWRVKGGDVVALDVLAKSHDHPF
jgi:hypothetical protein